jgi:hypothetical protein
MLKLSDSSLFDAELRFRDKLLRLGLCRVELTRYEPLAFSEESSSKLIDIFKGRSAARDR